MAIYPVGNVGKFTKDKLKVSHLQNQLTLAVYTKPLRIAFLPILIGYSNSEYTGIYEKGLQAKCFLCSFTVTKEDVFAVYELSGTLISFNN